MSCQCVSCPECNGTGQVFYSFSGKYRGPFICDDLDSMESCHECGGQGVSEICPECQEKYEEFFDDY